MANNSKHINLPYRLVKKYSKRGFKTEWELLVFAVCLKLNNADSGIYLRSIHSVMRLCNCSARKASRLMKNAAENKRFFRYNPKTKFLSARTFTIGCKCVNSRKGDKYYTDFCMEIKMPEDGRISHNDISRQIKDSVILMQAKNSRPRTSSQCQSTSFRDRERKPITHEYISNVVGCCRSTVTRRLNIMEDSGRIKTTRYEKIAVADFEHNICYREVKGRSPFLSGRFLYIRDVNEYEILDSAMPCQFKHVIYNHSKRITKHPQIKITGPWDICHL